MRVDEREANALATRGLEAARGGRRAISFDTNVLDLSPGAIFAISKHARKDLSAERKLLVTEATFEGAHDAEWTISTEAVFADAPVRPAKRTPRPRIHGVQSAVVVGPEGDEIHTDEFGRVRVQFHWDREGRFDDASSCWIRVSQGWAGSSYGMVAVPRVGHEVLVEFFDGDPDRPVITGRVYNNTTRVPYKLPDHKTRSGWKSDSSPGSNGYNELAFEDAKGREVVHIQAQRDYSELIKRNQSSTVMGERTSSVAGGDALTVGDDHTVNVGKSERRSVGADLATDVGGNRSVSIAGHDALDVGRGYSVSVASGAGSRVAEQQFQASSGQASIVLDGANLYLDAVANLVIRAGGTIFIHGREVQLDGSPNVFVNCASAMPPSVTRVPAARAPGEPARPRGEGGSSDLAAPPGGALDVDLPGGFDEAPPNPDAPGLGEIIDPLPASPEVAPNEVTLPADVAKEVRSDVEAAVRGDRKPEELDKKALIKKKLDKAMEYFKIAQRLYKTRDLTTVLAAGEHIFGEAWSEPMPWLGGLSGDQVADAVSQIVKHGQAFGLFTIPESWGAAAGKVGAGAAAAMGAGQVYEAGQVLMKSGSAVGGVPEAGGHALPGMGAGGGAPGVPGGGGGAPQLHGLATPGGFGGAGDAPNLAMGGAPALGGAGGGPGGPSLGGPSLAGSNLGGAGGGPGGPSLGGPNLGGAGGGPGGPGLGGPSLGGAGGGGGPGLGGPGLGGPGLGGPNLGGAGGAPNLGGPGGPNLGGAAGAGQGPGGRALPPGMGGAGSQPGGGPSLPAGLGGGAGLPVATGASGGPGGFGGGAGLPGVAASAGSGAASAASLGAAGAGAAGGGAGGAAPGGRVGLPQATQGGASGSLSRVSTSAGQGAGGSGAAPPTAPGPGGAQAPLRQYMALRTLAAPPELDASKLAAHTEAFQAAGMSPEKASAKAMAMQGVALYRGNFSGKFVKLV